MTGSKAEPGGLTLGGSPSSLRAPHGREGEPIMIRNLIAVAAAATLAAVLSGHQHDGCKALGKGGDKHRVAKTS